MAGSLNPFGEFFKTPERDNMDESLAPAVRGFNQIPNPFAQEGADNIFPGDAPGNSRGPRNLTPGAKQWQEDNIINDWRAPLTKTQYPGGQMPQEGQVQDEGKGRPALPAKDPWELTPQELGAQPAQEHGLQGKTPDRDPWEMTAEELNGPRSVTLEQKAPQGGSGARGAPAQPVTGDRSSAYGRAQRAGVGLEGVSAAARYNARLAWGAVNDPEQEMEIARAAISRDLNTDYPIENVRIGPATRQLEWVNPKTGKWDLFGGGGVASWLKDVAAAVPEIQEGATEATAGTLAGAAGAVIGAPAGPLASAGLGTAANSTASAVTAYYARLARLQTAVDRGLIKMSDNEMWQNAFNHALWVGGGTVATAALLRATSMIWKFYKGSPVELLDAYQHNMQLAEGKPLAEALRSRVKSAVAGTKDEGADFPVTAGQQTALPEVLGPRAGKLQRSRTADEMLLAENAASRQRVAGTELDKTYGAQERSMDAVDFSTFGSKYGNAGAVAGRQLQGAIGTARTRMEIRGVADMAPARAGKGMAEQLTETMGEKPVGEHVANIRQLLADAKDQLYMPFKNAYDKLEKDSKQIVDLAPLRAAARRVKKTYGQDIAKALDATDIPEVKQLLQAGKRADAKPFTKGETMFEDKSIGELIKLDKDLAAQVRKLENAPASNTIAPRAASVLRDLRDGIQDSFDASLQPEMLTYMHNLKAGYAAAMDQYERGIIGKITAENGAGGYTMTGNDVINFLLKDPENAKGYIDIIRQSKKWVDGTLVQKPLGDATASAIAVQNGVMSKILREYKDAITGKWDTKGLARFLHDNNEALQNLFSVRRSAATGELVDRPAGQNAMNRFTRQITTFQNEADALEARLAKQSKMFNERFGVYTADPAVLVKTLVDEGRVTDLRRAAALVRATGGRESYDKFKQGLGQVVRGDVTNGRGEIVSQKVEEFLASERGRVIGDVLGKEWKDNVALLGDMMKVRELQATGAAPGDLAGTFGKGGGALKGFYRYLRVIMPPLTASGRGLTSTVGILNDKSQKIFGQLMADPARLQKLLDARFSPLDPLTKHGKIQLTRLGFEHVVEFWQHMDVIGRAKDMLAGADAPVDERPQKAEYEQMGKPKDIPPTDGSIPGNVPSFEKRFEGPPGQMDVPKTPRTEYVPRGMGQPGDFPENGDTMQGQPQYPTRSDSGIATDPFAQLPPRVPPGAKRIQDLQIMRAGEGEPLQSDASPDLTTVPKTGYIPRSFEGAAGFLGGNSAYTQGKGFQMKGPGDEGFNPRESTNTEMRANENGWLTPEQQTTTEFQKGSSLGRGFMYRAGEAPPEPTGQEMSGAARTAVLRTQDRNAVEDAYGADVFKRIAPHAVENAEATLKGMLSFASSGVRHMKEFGEAVKDLASGDMFKTDNEKEVDRVISQSQVLEALRDDPATTIEREIAPTVNKIVKAVGGAATVIGGHLMSLMEDAVYGDEHAQAKASAEIALIVTGLSGSRFAFARPAGEVSIGAGGGRLPPEPPPRRLAGNETMRDRLRTVEGGPEVVKKEIDTLSGKLSRALQDAHEAMATGKGEIPLKVDRVRGHIQALEKASDDLMEQAKSLAPPLGPNQFKDLKAMNMTEHEYRLQMLRETNAEIDMGKREAFQLMATGRDAKMEVTPKNIKEWLEAAGVKKVTITKSDVPGSVSQYVKFPDPANKGQGMSQVRTSDHAAEAQVVRTNRDTLDTSGKNPRAGQAGKALTENISGGNFAEWKNLVEALKYRLSKSPDGQWLISPDNAPLARSFRGARNATKVKALEAERDATISRDPNQMELPLPDTRQSYTPVAPDPTRFMTPRPPRNNPFEGLGE